MVSMLKILQRLIYYNNIDFTGDDGIEVVDGDFVSIYDNYLDFIGFLPSAEDDTPAGVGIAAAASMPTASNYETFFDEEYGADAIHVRNVGEAEVVTWVPGDSVGPGVSVYDADSEITGNEIGVVSDDGIEVINELEEELFASMYTGGSTSEPTTSTYIGENIIGHTGGNGITTSRVTITKIEDNAISLAERNGIDVLVVGMPYL